MPTPEEIAAAAAAATVPWTQGLDAETLGHIQNKAWDKLDAKDAAIASVKAYREAERMIGMPPSEVLRLPKDAADAAGWNALYAKLGRPMDQAGYDFASIKRSDGTDLDAATADAFRKAAYDNGLSKEAAARLLDTVVKHQDSTKLAGDVEHQAKIALEKDALAKNWGTNMAANMFVAQRAAAALGISPEEVAMLEKQVGYSKVMEMFRNIGTKIGEDKFVSSGNNPSGVMTKDQAVARKADLMKDTAWTKRYLDGGTPEAREMQALTRIIVGDA